MGSVVVMGDPKLLNLFYSQCRAVVVVRECPKALSSHEFCGIVSASRYVEVQLLVDIIARVLSQLVNFLCPVT